MAAAARHSQSPPPSRFVQPFDHCQGDATAERQQRAGSVSLEDIGKGVRAVPADVGLRSPQSRSCPGLRPLCAQHPWMLPPDSGEEVARACDDSLLEAFDQTSCERGRLNGSMWSRHLSRSSLCVRRSGSWNDESPMVGRVGF